MRQKELSVWLRITAIIIGIFLVLSCIFLAPASGREAEETVSGSYWWTVISLYVTAAIAFWALGSAYLIFMDIGRDKSFTHINALRLRRISILAAADAAIYLIIFGVLAVMGALNPVGLLIRGAIALFCAGVSAACAALSHLTAKAAAIQADNDLTI